MIDLKKEADKYRELVIKGDGPVPNLEKTYMAGIRRGLELAAEIAYERCKEILKDLDNSPGPFSEIEFRSHLVEADRIKSKIRALLA